MWEARWCGRPDLVDDHGGAVEPFVVNGLEAPLELGDHLLVRIFVRYEMEDFLVVSLFYPVLYLREVTGLTGLCGVSLTRIRGPQVVVEPVGGVAADDQGVLALVADDVEGGLALLFLGRGGGMSEQVLQVHQYLLDPGQTVVVVA